MLSTLGWCLLAAGLAWILTLLCARASFRARCEALDDEIARWQAESARARIMLAHLKRERAIWLSGYQQGRADIVTTMPLWVAAQQGLRDAEVPASHADSN
jgi:hypothetical protein